MLIITRRQNERIMLGDDIVLEVLEVGGGSVRIGITAPRSVPVYREELLHGQSARPAEAAPTPGH